MELTKKEQYEIAKMVVEILDNKHRNVSRSWIALRKEIRNYCENDSENVRWATLQSKIYDTIRACLNISRLDDMTDEQVMRAQNVFSFIKLEREATKNGRTNESPSQK